MDMLLLLANLLLLALIYLAVFQAIRVVRAEMKGHLKPAELKRAPEAFLRILSANEHANQPAGTQLPLKSVTLIGSNPDNDLELRDKYVSGKHAIIRWNGEDWTVEDLASTNGTLLNGRSLPPRQQEKVPAGATLVLGDFELELSG